MDSEAINAKMRAGFGKMVADAGDDARRLCDLAKVAGTIGLPEQQYPLAKRAQGLAPEDAYVTQKAQAIIAKGVGQWHFNMLHDRDRDAVYDAAIRRVVRPGDHVLDIGSGSGLLAMMAARAGAARVISCESNPAIADIARDIVAQNGYADRVTILSKSSTEIDVEEDLGRHVDVIVSEIIADNLLSEDVLGTLDDARRRLLAPGGRMIPSGGDIMVALAHYPDNSDISDVSGFDLSQFKRLRKPLHTIDSGDTKLALRSSQIPIFSFDFVTGEPGLLGETVLNLRSTGGPINGVVQWIRIHLDADGFYENRPAGATHSHWGPRFATLPRTINPVAGSIVPVHARYNRKVFDYWVDPADLPAADSP